MVHVARRRGFSSSSLVGGYLGISCGFSSISMYEQPSGNCSQGSRCTGGKAVVSVHGEVGWDHSWGAGSASDKRGSMTVLGTCSPAQAGAYPRVQRGRGLCREGSCKGCPTPCIPPPMALSFCGSLGLFPEYSPSWCSEPILTVFLVGR